MISLHKIFKNYSLFVLFLVAALTSCKKDFLDVTPRDQLSSETVFSDQSGADLFLNDIYGSLPDEDAKSYNYDAFENWSDNAVCSFHWAMSWVLGVSKSYSAASLNPGLYNHDYPAMPFMYNHTYNRIRRCNVFIEQVEKNASNFSDEWKTQRIAEARFLRAFLYHKMWMAYGGVPIVTRSLNQSEQGDAIFQPRNTSEETFAFIQSELADIAGKLPANNTKGSVDEGRAGKAAALALKGWVELFAHKYEEAAATNKQLIDELGNGNPYDLFANYNDQFMVGNNNNKESIFSYQHDAGSRSSYRNNYYGPKGNFNGWGAMQPTQNLVDDYVMANGLPITDAASGYDPAHPYEGRESRFYQSIIFDGTDFAGQTYHMKAGEQFALNPGAENNTGYFRRKGIDASLIGNLGKDGANYNFFRYAEVLLNYAEASIEAGNIDNTVTGAIDKIRTRSGLPTLEDTYHRSLSQNELREIVRRERRVELAFENKRWWDLIRWKTAEVVLNQPKYGVEITQQSGQWVYNTRSVVHTQEFLQRNYLFPIYQGWIDANPEIKSQNGGPDNWSNGQNPGY
ncbi:MAG: RagB/SusD family nutrient uptake outer membrane protein [Sphingobacteriales bacterium]|nr:RagB/SusD family nutrient uptake outer membrane protein [Sphingobacteriales bacterium]OJY92037.1 MAG: hypothetical protein BGP14_24350 [Sphingobacteriales bacterium 44-15]